MSRPNNGRTGITTRVPKTLYEYIKLQSGLNKESMADVWRKIADDLKKTDNYFKRGKI